MGQSCEEKCGLASAESTGPELVGGALKGKEVDVGNKAASGVVKGRTACGVKHADSSVCQWFLEGQTA